MKNHFKYLWYVLRHKWFVVIEGKKLDIPLWRLIIHDWQKFTPSEWKSYVLTFYGEWKYKERPQWLIDLFNKAWLHHIHHGPHHWQHWILIYDDDKEEQEILDMPNVYRLEMLADWRAAGIAITGEDNTLEWYNQRRDKFKRMLHPNTRKWIEQQLDMT